MSVEKSKKYKRAISLAVAVQLSFSLSALGAWAEGDVLSNSGLPLAQPEPSKLVQRIWSSLDLRHRQQKNAVSENTTAKKTSEASAADLAVSANEASNGELKVNTAKVVDSKGAKSPSERTEHGQAAPNKNAVPAKNTNDSSEASDTARGVTITGQQMMQTDQAEGSAQSGSVQSEKASLDVDKESVSAQQDLSHSTKAEENTADVDKPFKIASALGVVSLPPGSVLTRIQAPKDDALIIDNDEAQEVQQTLKEEVLPLTADGKAHAKAGARFPVVLASELNSKTAKQGDLIKARLKFDLKIGDRLVAQKGAIVNGHVNYVLHARTIMNSLLSPERWYRNSGCLGLAFDEIINEKGEHLPLTALPSRQARIVKNKAEGRELGVNHNGQVVGPWSEQIKYKCIRIGLNAALAPAGVFTFGAMPVALGVLGAASPSFAFAKPVGLNVRHRRLKGFAWGFLSGIPGSFIIEDTTIKGQEAIVKPGDEFYAELVEEFTGEPASDAQLMPGATTKVHAQVLKKTSKKVKKNG